MDNVREIMFDVQSVVTEIRPAKMHTTLATIRILEAGTALTRHVVMHKTEVYSEVTIMATMP